MQYLRVQAIPSEDGQFDVFWTNTTLETVRGIAHVLVPQVNDRQIIAELHTLQYLLEDEKTFGANAVGRKTLKLVVSNGAIRKLTRKSSAKNHLVDHAKFLTTRFYGCQIEVEKDEGWTSTVSDGAKRVELDASIPHEETIVINGLGEVSVTSHVVERFAEHLTEKRDTNFSIGEAWRILRDIAAEKKVTEVNMSNAGQRIKYALSGGQEGRYFVHPTKGWVFVCSKYATQKRLALVTAYALH